MAGTRKNDLLGRLADLGDGAMQRLSEAPGGDKLLTALNGLRERTDELQKRVRGLETLEKRLAALERKVDKLAKGAGSSTKATSTKSSGSSTAKKS